MNHSAGAHQHKVLSSYCELVLLLQCWCVLPALELKEALSSGRFGAPGWLVLMGACPWNSRYSETMRGGYKCCLSGFMQLLRCLGRGQCPGMALPRKWRDEPARRGEHPALLLSYRAKPSLCNTYSASNCSYWEQQEMSLAGSIPLIGERGEGAGAVWFIPKWSEDAFIQCGKTRRGPALYIYIYGVFGLRFPVVHSPPVRCLLLLPRENSKLCKSNRQVLLNCKPMGSLICALKGGPATGWTACEWSC